MGDEREGYLYAMDDGLHEGLLEGLVGSGVHGGDIIMTGARRTVRLSLTF